MRNIRISPTKHQSFPVGSDQWWETSDSGQFFVRKIRYNTGDVVVFQPDGSVAHVITYDDLVFDCKEKKE